MTEVTQPRLPDKPSDLLRLATADLITVENDPRYEVYMNEWHEFLRSIRKEFHEDMTELTNDLEQAGF